MIVFMYSDSNQYFDLIEDSVDSNILKEWIFFLMFVIGFSKWPIFLWI